MSVTRQRPPGVGPPNEHDTTPWVPGRPLWQQFLIGAVGVLLVVGAILLVVRFWAIPALQSRGADTGVAGEATLAALQTQQALTPRPDSHERGGSSRPTYGGAYRGADTGCDHSADAGPCRGSYARTDVAADAISHSYSGCTAHRCTLECISYSGERALQYQQRTEPHIPFPLPPRPAEVAAAVSDAYLHYWSVRADALLALDSSASLDQSCCGG